MTTPNVTATVLVPILNEEGFLPRTLPAMLAQDLEEEIEFLLLDGGSSDRTLEILRDFADSDPRIRVLDNPGRLQSHALALGLREARGEYIVRMDAHTFYPPNYVSSGIARLRKGDVAWVAGPQIPFGTEGWSARIAAAMRNRLGVGGASFRFPQSEEMVSDAAFTGILSRALLEDLGGWDRDWRVNEDGELAARVRAGGGTIVCLPEMAADCATRASLSGLARQYRKYGYDRAMTERRHPGSLRRSHLLPVAVLTTLAASVLSPRPLRRLARIGMGVYLAALAWGAADVGKRDGFEAGLAAPLVFVTMHLCWAEGFVRGWIQERDREPYVAP